MKIMQKGLIKKRVLRAVDERDGWVIKLLGFVCEVKVGGREGRGREASRGDQTVEVNNPVIPVAYQHDVGAFGAVAKCTRKIRRD